MIIFQAILDGVRHVACRHPEKPIAEQEDTMRLLLAALSVMIAFTTLSIPVYAAVSAAGEPAQATQPALSADKSVVRRKELEAIERSEAAALQLNRKENSAIQKMQAELDEIDRQVAAMKSRLESGKPRANDRAEAIKAMIVYKAEHAGQLEELRKKHKESEQKQIDEINKLKKSFNEKWTAEIYDAVGRYQQVATNKYLRNRKDAAWDALTAEFSEAGAVKRHDVAALLAKMGVSLPPGLDQACHIDRENGLMWVKSGNLAGKTMAWGAAVSWASALDYGGFSDWRLPTAAELLALAKSGGQRPADFLNKSGFSNVQSGLYWSSTVSILDGNSLHRNVSMKDGSLEDGSVEKEFHVWPVRETGLQRQKIRVEVRE